MVTKRGLSDVIVSVLIILVGLAAVALIYAFINSLSQSSVDNAKSQIENIRNLTDSAGACVIGYSNWSLCGLDGIQTRTVASSCSGQTPVTSQTCIPFGLIASYDYESTSGSTVSDSSTNGNTGTLENGATITFAGKVGNAILLNGGDQDMSVPSTSMLNPSNSFSISLWTSYTTLQPYNALIAKSNYDSSNLVNGGYGIFYNSNLAPGGLCLYINSITPRACASLSGYPSNTFFHVVGTYDGSTLRLYLNNVNVASTSASASITSTSAPLMVGRIYGAFTGSTIHWNGKVDEVMVFNRSLNSTEISYLYNNP